MSNRFWVFEIVGRLALVVMTMFVVDSVVEMKDINFPHSGFVGIVLIIWALLPFINEIIEGIIMVKKRKNERTIK